MRANYKKVLIVVYEPHKEKKGVEYKISTILVSIM